MEIWKDIEGYEGLYAVSNTGKVYSYKSKKILRSNATELRCGYINVLLTKDGKRKQKYIHRLVAQAFIPNPENKPEVNHIDHNPQNNHVDNLEWVTKNENIVAYLHSEKRKQAMAKLKAIAEQRWSKTKGEEQ